MSAGPPITVEKAEGVTIIRMSRPEQRNALVPEMRDALAVAVPAFFADVESGCLLLTGIDGAFCAGGDLRSFTGEVAPNSNRERIRTTQRWAGMMKSGDKPVVIAVNGPAVGAGFGLALLGDVVLAGESAFFQSAFPLVAMVPDMGLGQSLPKAVGAPRAKDILLTNRRVDSAEALQIGIVSRRVPDAELFDQAFDVARRLAKGPRLALGLTKALVRHGLDVDTPAYFELEAAYQGVAMGSADHAEGKDAFLNKRKPDFKADRG